MDKRGIDLLVSDALMHQPISGEMKRVEAISNRQSDRKISNVNVKRQAINYFCIYTVGPFYTADW